ncbi:hypothetical protein CEXT_751621 [Caerostris extrusa]|uniref:Uncharacterized protein n=1 Tax=Caerostris extrusa TaxID=172846 RepID=A0AAV4NNV9_CAEEX|nr:hypothetical protein CEXT_751621 [Caerostris extrusa]
MHVYAKTASLNRINSSNLTPTRVKVDSVHLEHKIKLGKTNHQRATSFNNYLLSAWWCGQPILYWPACTVPPPLAWRVDSHVGLMEGDGIEIDCLYPMMI